MRAQYYVFTLNNYTEEEETHVRSLIESNDVSYIVFGREVGANGTRHLQGYLELSRRLRLSQVRTLVSTRAHYEARRGSAQEASDYCKKDHDFEEYGNLSNPQQGSRTDLVGLKRSLDGPSTMGDIANEHFGAFLKYQRGILAYRNVTARQRAWQPSVIVYWGRTGSGKTRAVYDNLPACGCYTHPGGPWFDGYDRNEIVLFDDFGGSEFKISYLLKLLDRYPMQVPVKGGFVSWIPQEIYLTSNLDPRTWYSNAHQEHVDALFRRFTNVVHFE